MNQLDIGRIVGITKTIEDDRVSCLSVRYCDGRYEHFRGDEVPVILDELLQWQKAIPNETAATDCK